MTNARKPPAAGELHVWRIELPRDDPRARARSALAAILADYLGGAAEAALSADGDGKPRLAVRPERLSFNLSHSAGLALVAIAPGGTPVGIDVEWLRPRRDLVRLAARWLPAADATMVSAAAETERDAVFYAAWTRHEARVKCSGTGLAGPPPAPEVVARHLPFDEGYAAAVAVDAGAAGTTDPRVTLRTWAP
jgi:phosphopantetheinyl transferase